MLRLTSETAAFALTIRGVYNTPVMLKKWSLDLETPAAVKTRMSVDGVLSAGIVMQPCKMKITLEASSESQQVFDDWYRARMSVRDAIPASGTITTLAANGTTYDCVSGQLTGYKPLSYEITWQRAAPIR